MKRALWMVLASALAATGCISVSLPDGRNLLDAADVTFKPGHSVVVTGRSGSGKSTLFRAIAGIWPFGAGSVQMPAASALFLPQRPYIPLGTLRQVIAYPAAPEAYDQAAYAQNREQLIARRIRDSELARRRIGEPERAAYGPGETEGLDIYRTGHEAAPVFVFVHGGAWRSGRSKDYAAPAEMFLDAGAHYVVPDFAWVQDVGGNLMVLADQVRRFKSVRRIVSYHNIHEVPADLEEIYKKMCDQDADVVKIAVMAQQIEDNVRVLKLLKKAPKPTTKIVASSDSCTQGTFTAAARMKKSVASVAVT